MASSGFFIAVLFFFINFTPLHVSAGPIFEEGYTVTTILDGHKRAINPYSVLPLFGSSDLIILDMTGSAFYMFSFSDSQDSVIKRYSGNGHVGFTDGELDSAMFNKPKSFAVDIKGNVYVADKNNHAIRKISKSGVTTIAGGYSQKPGSVDGPGQNASFSDDFELAFIPNKCALIISDRGSQLLRQINLKVEDCARGSQSALGLTWAWALGVGVAALLGLIVGFLIRPYVALREVSNLLHCSETWKHSLINLGRRVLMFCFDIRSAIVSRTFYALIRRLIILSLSHLSLMFRLNNTVESRTPSIKFVSLLDSDILVCSKITKPDVFDEQLKGLVSFDGGWESLHASNKEVEQTDDGAEMANNLSNGFGNIERMIEANIVGFTEQSKSTSLADPLESNPSLFKRKCK